MHGHNYKANIIVRTDGVVDFKLLKTVFKELDHCTMSPEKHREFWKTIQEARQLYISVHGGSSELPQFKIVYLPVDELTVEEIGKYIRKRLEDISGVLKAEIKLFETDNCSTIIDEEVSSY